VVAALTNRGAASFGVARCASVAVVPQGFEMGASPRFVGLLFTDIERSTESSIELDDDWPAALEAHLAAVRAAVEGWAG
jgi:hypothetical protein